MNNSIRSSALVRMLVAEDDESTRQIFLSLLESQGHQVVVAADGDECIELYRNAANGSFALVILDYRMPHKDGITVAMEIQAINPKQRIMMATAYCREVMDEAARRLSHPIAFYEKPLDPEIFEEIVKKEAQHGAVS